MINKPSTTSRLDQPSGAPSPNNETNCTYEAEATPNKEHQSETNQTEDEGGDKGDKYLKKIVPILSQDANGRVDPKTAKFHKLLYEVEVIDLNHLKLIAWGGIPHRYRPLSWRLLLGYLPVTKSKREQQLIRKREEYERLIEQHYTDKSADYSMWRQIHIDIPRMQPLISVFQHPRVQESFERILYIWSIRHPASGYVQGMNDLVTPFFLTYLSEYCPSLQLQDVEKFDVDLLDDASLRAVEADTYWSFGKLLDSIQNNYTYAQPGIQRLVKMLATVVSRVDADLHNHLKANGVDYLQFAFRWMNNLLIRELPLRLVVRLWDSYLAEGFIATFTPSTNQNPFLAATTTISSTTSTSYPNQNHLQSGTGTQSSSNSLTSQISTSSASLSSSSSSSAGGPAGNGATHDAAQGSSQTYTTSDNQQTHTATSTAQSSSKMSSWNNGSETPFSASFHLFVCAAFLKSFSKDLLREQDFQGIMLMLQNLPTYHWSEQQIVLMLADAYHLKETFSPSHLRS